MGSAYWYAVYPVHALMFRGLLRRIALEDALRTVRTEESRLIEAVKQGHGLDILVTALHATQERRQAMERELTTLDSPHRELADRPHLRAALTRARSTPGAAGALQRAAGVCALRRRADARLSVFRDRKLRRTAGRRYLSHQPWWPQPATPDVDDDIRGDWASTSGSMRPYAK